MKKNFTTDAINLKSYPLNDNDSIVVMFSKDKGLIKTIAKGAKKPKSKLGARIQMFIANRLMLLSGKNFDTIAQAQSLNTFSKIRYDLDKMSYSMYIVELVSTFCSKQFNQDENYEEIYKLIFETFENISISNTKSDVLYCVLKFQIKLMEKLGWGLDFNYCSNCQNKIQEENSIFSFVLGGFICKDCISKIQIGENIKIHSKIRIFLNELTKIDINEKTRYDSLVNEIVLERCFLFMKKYIDNLTNKKTKIFKVLNQMESIKNA